MIRRTIEVTATARIFVDVETALEVRGTGATRAAKMAEILEGANVGNAD